MNLASMGLTSVTKWVEEFVILIYCSASLILNLCGTTNRILVLTVTAILMPGIVIVIVITAIYKYLITSILRKILGSQFQGLITGYNLLPFMIVGNMDYTQLYVALTLTNKGSQTDLAEMLQQRIRDKLLPIKDICVEIDFFLGYFYKKQANAISIHDVFEVRDCGEYWFNDEEIRAYPRDGKFAWKVYLLVTPHNHIILFSINHCLVDWLSLYNLVTDAFCFQDVSKSVFGKKLSASLKNKPLYQTVPYIFPDTIGTARDKLAITNDYRRRITTFFSEEQSNYFEKIKKIRKLHPSSTQTSIIQTALSASIVDFFEKTHCEVPQFIQIQSPVQFNTERYAEMFNNKFIEKFGNRFTCLSSNVPSYISGKGLEESIVERLEWTDDHLKRVYSSFQIKMTYWALGIGLENVPYQLLFFIYNTLKATCAMSQIVGGPKLRCLNNDFVQSMHIFIENTRSGILMFPVTYDDRLHISLTHDKMMFKSTKELNVVLQKFLHFIDVLYERISDPSCFEQH